MLQPSLCLQLNSVVPARLFYPSPPAASKQGDFAVQIVCLPLTRKDILRLNLELDTSFRFQASVPYSRRGSRLFAMRVVIATRHS